MASIDRKLLLPILAILLGHTVSGNEIEKRLLLNDPAYFANLIQQLESKISELNLTVAHLQISEAQLQTTVAHLQASEAQLQTTVAHLQESEAQLQTTVAHLQASEAQLQATHIQEIADLRAALNAEKLERCRTGRLRFHHEECAQGQCNENQNIFFSPPFSKPPLVAVSFAMMDVNEDRNLRIRVDVSHVATNSAIITVDTWSNTIVHSSDVTWIACPQL